jgi:hypothetical protein
MGRLCAKLFFSLVSFAVCAIPLWVWLGVHSLVHPVGFWQEIALGIVGMYALGAMQIVLIIVFIFTLTVIWDD